MRSKPHGPPRPCRSCGVLLRQVDARYCMSAECQLERQREYQRERRQDSTVRERRREYDREYRQNPTVRERRRERDREYHQDPTVRERRQDPTARERQREYQREYRQNPTVRERNRGYSRRRQALKRSVAVVHYKDRDIFERDRWMCGICGKRVNKRLKHPDPLSASIDHILPLSHGGHDVPSNVQCTIPAMQHQQRQPGSQRPAPAPTRHRRYRVNPPAHVLVCHPDGTLGTDEPRTAGTVRRGHQGKHPPGRVDTWH